MQEQRFGTVSKYILPEGLNWFHGANVTGSRHTDSWFAINTPNLSMHHLLEHIIQDIKKR